MPLSIMTSGAATTHGAVVPIAYAIATSTQSIIAFANIPQNYQDLVCVVSGRSDLASTTGGISFYLNNANATTGFSATNLLGNGSSAKSSRATTSSPTYGFTFLAGTVVPAASSTSGLYASFTLNILNYANSSTYKTGIMRVANDLNGSGTVGACACLWQNTSPITIIALATNGNWVSGTTFALYGIRSVNQ